MNHFRFPAVSRLKTPRDFDRVYATGIYAADDVLVINAAASELSHPRLGLAVSKRSATPWLVTAEAPTSGSLSAGPARLAPCDRSGGSPASWGTARVRSNSAIAVRTREACEQEDSPRNVGQRTGCTSAAKEARRAMMKILTFVWRIPSRICIGCIRVYQWTLSPFIGQQCRFYPTCSHYTISAIEKYGARSRYLERSLADLPLQPVQPWRLRPAVKPQAHFHNLLKN